MPNNIKKRDIEVEEMDLKPFMNLMVVLIPLLLASAQFAKIATVDISLPKGGAVNDVPDKGDPPKEKKLMKLTTMVTDTNFTLATNSGALLSIYFNEFHDYVSSEDNSKKAPNVEYKPLVMYDDSGRYIWDKKYPDSLMNIEGFQYSIYEREEIKLWALAIKPKTFEKTNEPWKGIYRVRDTFVDGMEQNVIEYITKGFDEDDPTKPFFPLTMADIKPGEEYYAFTTRMSPYQRRERINYKMNQVTGEPEKDKEGKEIPIDTTFARVRIKITPEMIAANEFEVREASAYDILKDVFLEVRFNNKEAEDVNSLIIASEHQVFYDKVVQIMDVAKNSGLTGISLVGFRSN